jgi:hypothetical protein
VNGLSYSQREWKKAIRLPTGPSRSDSIFEITLRDPGRYEDTSVLSPVDTCPYLCATGVTLKLNPAYVSAGSGFSLDQLARYHSPEVDDRTVYGRSEEDGAVTLEKCFEFFSSNEVLDEQNQWFCPR